LPQGTDISAAGVIAILRRPQAVRRSRGKPGTITLANGPAQIREKLVKGVEKRGISIQHIQPGLPRQGSFNPPGMAGNTEATVVREGLFDVRPGPGQFHQALRRKGGPRSKRGAQPGAGFCPGRCLCCKCGAGALPPHPRDIWEQMKGRRGSARAGRRWV
jgi:hypothetical protein